MSTLPLRAIALLVGLLPWRGVQRLGAFLGLAWFHALRIRRRTVFANLAIALPERAAEHRAIAAGCYRNLGASALELVRTRRMTRDEIAARVRTEGLDRYERARARGRGVVVVTAHLGNFDLLAMSQAARGVPLAIVSRTMRATASNAFWMETRARSGLAIFTEEEMARRSLPWLRAGNAIGLVMDQRTRAPKGGVLAPFFGRRVWTSTAAARLAARTGAAILPVRIARDADGLHTLTVEPEIAPPGDGPRDVAAVTSAINATLERWIREAPADWMWLHRRFEGGEGPAA